MQQLVPFGDGGELKAALESTDSELLQISGVCQNAEISLRKTLATRYIARPSTSMRP